MNNTRRKQIAAIQDKLSQLAEDLQLIFDAEQEAFQNLPESIQYGERGERMEEVIDSLEQAIFAMEEANEHMENAKE